MAVKCVVLASKPHKKRFQDLSAAQQKLLVDNLDELKTGNPGVGNGYDVEYKAPDSNDGGNGGGGEPGVIPGMKPVLGYYRRGAWDFQEDAGGATWDKRFREEMRWEFCIPFDDISDASDFLNNTTRGQELSKMFTFVQIVPLTPLLIPYRRAPATPK